MTFASPDQPASYSWEATDEEVAARYNLPIESIVRFDLNTSPAPPGLAQRLLAEGRFEAPLSEYPPSDYRRLVAAAASTYGVAPEEILVGAGADEILDLIGKAFLPAGGEAVIPAPSYAMYRVITEQRGARAVNVPRLPAEAGWAIDGDAVRAAARTAQVVWLCSPNNPTGLAEPPGAIEGLLDGLATDAAADGRQPPIVALDEAYAEFTGDSLLVARLSHPNLVVIRTASKAYALAGLRVGFAIAQPATIARLAPVSPAGLRLHGQRDARHGGPPRANGDAGQCRPRGGRTRALRQRPGRRRLVRRTVRHEFPARPVRRPDRGLRSGQCAPPPRPRPEDVPGGSSPRRLSAPHGPRPSGRRSPDRRSKGNRRDRTLANEPPDVQLALADTDRQPLPADRLRDGIVRRGDTHIPDGQASASDQPPCLTE